MSDGSQAGDGVPTRIRRLPEAVIERIAAGEVIERPASVVRELLDNALDAGAASIRVEIRDGGLRLVRVSDDGHGMLADDLPLAIATHASSKVSALGDLAEIRTLGFRGEALASIAAVAELEVASAPDDSGLADTVSVGPDGATCHSTSARGLGTTVTVRNLFATVPARRALLRGPRGEAARVLAVVRAYALAHPGVSYTLVSDGLLVLQTHGGELAAAATSIFGVDAGAGLVQFGPIDVESGTLSGMVAGRALTFPGRDHIVIAVNGRPVANRGLLAAAEAGYRPLLRKDRHPLLVVRLEVPAERVDPNVHPAKTEVLLRDEAAVAAALRAAVHDTLGAAPLSAGTQAVGGVHERPIQLRLPTARRRHYPRIAEGRSLRYRAVGQPEHDVSEDVGGLTALGQFDDMLILARSTFGSLYLVDQHRAHERTLYEQLKLRAATLREAGHDGARGSDSLGTYQLLLEPLLIELTPLQAARLAHRAGELAAFGLECQPFGGSVFLVRSLPDVSGAAQSPAGYAAELARAAAEDADDWLDQLCISLACRSAVRRGDRLTPAEQQQLLNGLERGSARAVCPHGSPLLLRLSASYLAQTFEW